MKKKLLIISQLPIWDLETNSGKVVFDKTVRMLSKEYNVTYLSVDEYVDIDEVNFIRITDMRLQKKITNIKFLGNIFNSIFPFFFYRKVSKIVSKHNIQPDLVYSVGPWSAYAAHLLFKGKCFIVNRFFGVAWNDSAFSTIKGKVKFAARKYFYRHYGNLVIMTDDGTRGKEFLIKCGVPEASIHFLKNGIDMKVHQQIDGSFKEGFISLNNIGSNPFFMLTVSRLAKWKNVDRSIMLLHQINKKHKSCYLLIVGDGEERPYLEQLVMQLDLARNVFFIGSIPNVELYKYYSIADVFLSLYSHSNAGNPLFEAMLYGKAIITINNGDTNHFIDKNSCILLDDYNEEDLLSAFTCLFLDSQRRQDLGNNAKIKIKNTLMSWEDRLSNELQLIQKYAQLH